ncbi:12803_t:CDS:2 [Funneliformis geosporum]|uniref:12803_t:CDS:1 n=1 Tax=Funneliformis geosporum TaxID=1117311 RepID=A0A9W4SUR1_9GLOM|nr:12803_t:CDS:2 [Funneliformis geosporum]
MFRNHYTSFNYCQTYVKNRYNPFNNIQSHHISNERKLDHEENDNTENEEIINEESSDENFSKLSSKEESDKESSEESDEELDGESDNEYFKLALSYQDMGYHSAIFGNSCQFYEYACFLVEENDINVLYRLHIGEVVTIATDDGETFAIIRTIFIHQNNHQYFRFCRWIRNY